jgi:type IV pilus assembly protein PilP
LSACGGANDDLRVYIDEVKARPGGRIEPLPPVEPAPTYVYEAGPRRSPFMPDAPQRRVSNDPNAVDGPDANRPREFLEQFPLDTLRMVGTLQLQGRNYGLVQGKDGLVHRVLPGNFVGQNDGKIVGISSTKISVIEIVPDGLGGYIERPAALALTE